jgi:DNA modification methylase
MKATNSDEKQFQPENTTVWDFPARGAWATHKPDYRGNFAPQIPRNAILNYSEEGELVLDPMVGSGTTLIEARLLNRNAIGIDINPNAVNITTERIGFEVPNPSQQIVRLGNAQKLVTHPPYLNLVPIQTAKTRTIFRALPAFPNS